MAPLSDVEKHNFVERDTKKYKPEMAVPLDDTCRCGRTSSPTHCPNCGRKTLYAKASKAFTHISRLDGSLWRVMVYKCRGCGVDFDDLDRKYNCEAPPTAQMSLKIQRALDEVRDLPFEERVKLAKQQLAKYGKEASKKPFEIGDDRDVIQQALSQEKDK